MSLTFSVVVCYECKVVNVTWLEKDKSTRKNDFWAIGTKFNWAISTDRHPSFLAASLIFFQVENFRPGKLAMITSTT